MLVKNQGAAEDWADALFEAALGGNGRAGREAAAELMVSLLTKGDARAAGELLRRMETRKISPHTSPALLTLRGALLYEMDRFDDVRALYQGYDNPGPWDRAFLILAALGAEVGTGPAPGEIRDFFLSGAPGAAQRWALGEIGSRLSEYLSPAEAEAVAGRFSLVRSVYGEGLAHFRKVLAMEEELFFQYPDMLGDLGRAFQFTAAQNEGAELFLGWDRRIRGGWLRGTGYDIPGIRYRILYYAGRIQRQIRRYAPAAESFKQALAVAPDALQEDACIWYILNMSLTERPRETVGLVRTYISRWNSDAYFADILDRLAQYLTANRRWSTLAEVFTLIRDRSDGGSIAKYAYILGRAVSEAYISAAEAAMSAAEFYKIAFEEGNASFYYRALAASRLGENTVPIPPGSGRKDKGEKSDRMEKPGDFLHGDDMEFLLGFFSYGSEALVFPYLWDDTDRFTTGELQVLANAFGSAGRWAESIRVVSSYINREDYVIDRRDMELFYPRPFEELIETRARDVRIPVEVLFGLIRTESTFVPEIRSWAGAYGLAQLMPDTAREMAERISRLGGPNYINDGKVDLEDPAVNIHLGAVYLAYLTDRVESPMMALLAYNGGIGRLRRWRNAEPSLPGDLFLETIEYPETREYGRKVLAAAAAYGYLYYNMTMESVIDDIYR
jgi:soluble lytic murein transglycosylase